MQDTQLEVLNQAAGYTSEMIPFPDKLARIVRLLRQAFGWEVVALFLPEEDDSVLVCHALATTLDTNLHLGWTFPTQLHPLPSKGTEESSTCEPIPLPHRGKPLKSQQALWLETAELRALFQVESSRKKAFDAYRKLLHMVGSQICHARVCSNRLEEIKRHMALTGLLSHISRVAVDDSGLEACLSRITETISANFPISIASIILLDDSGEHFELEISNGPLELAKATETWPISIGVCGRAVREGKAQLIHADTPDPDYVPGNPLVESEYVVPIRFHGQILGVLNLESTVRTTFSDNVCLILNSIANQIAGIIQIALTNQRLEEKQRVIEMKTAELEEANTRLADANEEMSRANEELETLSMSDGLTGLANRRYFDDYYDRECRRAARNGEPISLILLDVDHFKDYNDTYGHLLGDQCLIKIAKAIRTTVQRGSEWAARVGGEEFAIVLSHHDHPKAQQVAETLRQRVEELGIEHRASNTAKVVTISLGVATCAQPPPSFFAATLFQCADDALYNSKHQGRNRVTGICLDVD